MTRIKDIIAELEKLAPRDYQESYDNAGLLVGSANTIVTGILFSLDVTEAVVAEAREKNCNLIVGHHPIIFKGLKKLSGNTYVERTVLSAIRNDIAIYAIHTNLDHVLMGVNWMICQKLGLHHVKILSPKKHLLSKLTFFSPVINTSEVVDAIFKAGGGRIGNYEHCSFRVNGTGTFLPGTNANPAIGQIGRIEEVIEDRVEVMFPSHLQPLIVSALKSAHPYEEVAYYITLLENENQEVGAGAVGDLTEPLDTWTFLSFLKDNMELRTIRHTEPVSQKISRVAVCGGAGSFLLPDAIRSGADVFITADYKYHEFFDADGKIMICDIGHYESEIFTKKLLYNYLSEKFSTFALYLSEISTNPVRYFV